MNRIDKDAVGDVRICDKPPAGLPSDTILS